MTSPPPDVTKTLTYLLEVETVAQDILTLKDTKLELAHTLSKLQESLRAFQASQEKKSFIKVGSIFIEYPTGHCEQLVRKEIENVKEQYEVTSKELKDKLSKKRDIEHEPKIEGIGLRPLSHTEAIGLLKGFGLDS
ncbi:hypothetical protein PPYR_10202 [Photinus pyralis]|uniref:Prefoldin subunit 1 n=1 Tax=Photinus pyralis TaxID=7054 RepID=A0A5N4AFQ2_PHOPY|nr:hypothetical protein PPYR_10202 [Photinus pyralis]